jgi:hypothetical protein
LQALAGADQERSNLLPQRHRHQADASCGWARTRDALRTLALDEHLLIAELGDAAIGF